MYRSKRAKKRTKKRCSMEFSKKLAAWAVIAATASGAASYVLAFFDKQPVGDVTTAIFTGCIGYLVTYAAKSATEKLSRNRHGLDPDGKPFQTEESEGQDTSDASG